MQWDSVSRRIRSLLLTVVFHYRKRQSSRELHSVYTVNFDLEVKLSLEVLWLRSVSSLFYGWGSVRRLFSPQNWSRKFLHFSISDDKIFLFANVLFLNKSSPFLIDDVRFKELFRFYKDMAQYVLNGILTLLDQRNNPVAILSLLNFLLFLIFMLLGHSHRQWPLYLLNQVDTFLFQKCCLAFSSFLSLKSSFCSFGFCFVF